MIKKSLLLTLLLAILAPWAAQAQTTVEIGDGTSNNYNTPIGTYYNYSITEQLYTAEEIGTGGTISSISFNYAGTAAKDLTITVYMKNVDATDLSTGITLADAAIVFDGTLSVTGAGWATITLANEFDYDGTSNLLIGVKKDAPSWYSGGKWYYTEVNNMARYSQQDGSTPYTTSTVPGTATNQRPNIQIEITPAGGATCAKPDNLIAYNEPTATSFYFSIDGGSGVYNIELKEGSGDWEPSASQCTDTVYGWNDLESNTAYQVRVQSVCDGGLLTSGWKTMSFTTANPCAAPTNLAVSDITASSATLSWTAGYQETEWTVKYKKSTDAWENAIVETVSGTPTLALSNLDGLTTYNVQVYNCENYVSANFTTAAGIPLTEAFATTSAPTGWAKYSGLLSDVMGGTALTTTSSGWNFSTGNGVFDNHAKVNLYGTSCKYWLVTPTLLMENNVQLTFDLALTAYSGTNVPTPATNGSDDKFVVLISTDNMATWTILRQWDNAGSQYVLNNIACSAIGEAVAFDLSSYAGQSIAIAFYGESTVSNADNNLHIDNVSIDYIPACAKPTGLAASDVTAHEATITWTSDATAWQVQLDDEDPIDVEEATYTFENLDPETTYTAKVRANCSGTYSEWTTTVSFTTTIACPAPTVAVSNITSTTAEVSCTNTDATAFNVQLINTDTTTFANVAMPYPLTDLTASTSYRVRVQALCGGEDGESEWAAPVSFTTPCDAFDLPYSYGFEDASDLNCWDVVSTSSNTGIATASDAPEGSKLFQFYYSERNAYLISPVFSGTEQWGLDVAFQYMNSSTTTTYTEQFQVGYTTDAAAAPADFTYGETVYGENQWVTYENTFPANTKRIAIKYIYTDAYYLRLDDFSFNVPPLCPKPTGLVVSNITGHKATINWTSAAESWQICVNDDEENLIGTNDTTYTLTGLAPETAYTVKVRANCGDDGYSDWTDNVSFTTDVACPAPTNLAASNLTQNTADLTWNGDSDSYNVQYREAATTNQLLFEGFETYADEAALEAVWTVLDLGDGANTGELGLSSSAKKTGDYGFRFSSYSGSSSGSFDQYLISPELTKAGLLEFAYKSSNGTADKFRVGYSSTTNDVTAFTWGEEMASASSWTTFSETMPENAKYFAINYTAVYQYRLYIDDITIYEITPAGEWQSATSTTTSTQLTGLTAGTEYEVQVQGVCDTVSGNWSEAITFTTLDVIVWNVAADWPNDSVPEANADVTIPANTLVIIPSDCTAYADTITIEEGGSILIENGGQLYHSNEVPVTMQLAYDPNYTSSKDGEPEYGEYRLIAAPVNPGVPVSSTGLVPDSTDSNYAYVDLYYFDQNVGELVWINYKYEANHFDSLFIKKGYLYSNAQNVLGIFGGNTLPTSVNVKEPLVYNPEVLWAGWNLVGNPFTCMAFVDLPYYKINGDGNAIAQAEGKSLEVFEGVFVYTEQANDTVTFSTTAPDSGGGVEPGPEEFKMLTLNLNDGRSLIDRAIVRFDEGRQLLKLQMGSSTKVYIPKDGSDYAIVSSDDTGEMPVSFKAENDGTYTMNFSSENVNFSYLHLIDNKTGDDIDLLETPSYTFTARTNDDTNRFKLVFALGTTGIEESFAFFNNGNLVINNEGNATLQVVDVMGRILKSENIDGSASVKVDAAPGVYMIRLTNGNNVKVQKVVVE